MLQAVPTPPAETMTDRDVEMKDIQNLRDDRRISIRKVGVKTISYPVKVLDREKKTQATIARVNMYVNLPHRFKGTHMSRFVEILNRFHGEINLHSFHLILQEMKERLEAEAAHVEMAFPYFLERRDPLCGLPVTQRYECSMHGSLQEVDDLVMGLHVPIMMTPVAPAGEGLPRSLGRWGTARVEVRFNRFLWLEELIELVEQGFGREVAPPDSVESVTKNLGEAVAGHPAIAWYSIVVENLTGRYATFASVEGWGLVARKDMRDGVLETRSRKYDG
ncbi:MAG: GTP cyclohydrolase FolE2 [Desulfobulbaceae bacterium]